MRIWENKTFIPVHSSEFFILLPQECSMCCLFHRKVKKKMRRRQNTPNWKETSQIFLWYKIKLRYQALDYFPDRKFTVHSVKWIRIIWNIIIWHNYLLQSFFPPQIRNVIHNLKGSRLILKKGGSDCCFILINCRTTTVKNAVTLVISIHEYSAISLHFHSVQLRWMVNNPLFIPNKSF